MSVKKPEDHFNDMMIEWAPKINFHAKNTATQYGIDPEDLVSEVGHSALWHAIHTYDPNNISEHTNKPTSFKTHAEHTIKNAMRNYASKLSGGVSQNIKQQAAQFKEPAVVPPVTEIDPTGYIPQLPKV